MKKRYKRLLIALSAFLAIVILQTIPVFILKPFGAKELTGSKVNVYYQAEDAAGAKEVFDILEKNAEAIGRKLNFKADKPVDVYVYAKQPSLHIRKLGLITLLGAPKWFVGDNKGTKVVMVSPNAKVEGHDHESILSAAAHELVHTIDFQINPKLSYWLDNGVATYLSNQAPSRDITRYMPIPTIEDTRSENQYRFGNIGGYQYSYTYIEFLDKTYGWDKVVELVQGKKSYNEVFAKSEQDIYNEWTAYLAQNY